MKDFKRDLNDAAKATKALTLKIDKLQKQFAEMEKKHPKTPAKKAPTKKVGAKRVVATKTPVTAVDTVLAAIGRSKKGVKTSALIEKTGFEKQKVYNTISLLKKQGKIKATGRGRYAKA